MNNILSITPKISVFEASFDDNWMASISYGEGSGGTIHLPNYKDIGNSHIAIWLQAMGENEFGISSANFIPLLIYKVEKATGKTYNIKSLPIGHGTDVCDEHWISTQALNPVTNQITTVTFALCRKTGKDFNLTLIEE